MTYSSKKNIIQFDGFLALLSLVLFITLICTTLVLWKAYTAPVKVTEASNSWNCAAEDMVVDITDTCVHIDTIRNENTNE